MSMSDDDSPAPGINECIICHTRFKTFLPGQAYGCCATLCDGKLAGGYGSFVSDFMDFRTTEKWDSIRKSGEICDECILKLLDEGKLVFDRSQLPVDEMDSFDIEQTRQWFNECKLAGDIDYADKEAS